jgi:hypothetical protein
MLWRGYSIGIYCIYKNTYGTGIYSRQTVPSIEIDTIE